MSRQETARGAASAYRRRAALRRTGFIAACLAPALILYANFMIRPAISMLSTSFYKWSGLSPNKRFIGWRNYQMLVEDGKFWQAFGNTLWLMLVVTAITLVLALFFAAALSRTRLREKNFYRVVYFFPNVLSIVVIGTLFKNIYSTNNGILNALLRALGLARFTHGWLGETATVLPAIAAAMVWQAVGYYMVIYMAGMDGIDAALYEAAEIDGAGELRQFFSLTVPLIWETIRVTLVFFVVSSINMSFQFVVTMTNGEPNGASEVALSYMYKQGFTNANFGYGMTVATVVFLFAFLLSTVSNFLTNREKKEGGA